MNYRTGTSPAETVSIGGDQFDINRWDTDGDGVSNLEESITGTDPLLEPDLPAEGLVRASFEITVPATISERVLFS